MTTPARIFSSDNTAGASPEIVEAVTRAAAGQARPYGADDLTAGVRRRLGEIFEREVDLLLVSSGTAANALSLAALTPPWGSVLCHRDSHVNNDECGAPEFYTAGAKLVPLGGEDAKIDPAELRAAVRHKAGDVHSVEPSVVSLTQATETGAVYTPDEIGALGSLAREAGLRLHLDGARFAGAVAALGRTPAELTWRAGVDLLSFGATKNGTMTADAIVVFDRSLTPELSFRAKRAGQLAAKMRFQAAQLDAYLADGLWLRNAARANAMAARLQDGLKALPEVGLLGVADANIVFCRLSARITEGLLGEGYVFYHDRWEPGVARFVTSFATTEADVDGLLEAVRRYAG
ncbi:threonine aldolase family protein [Streptomyces sp. DSM 15324]|uniref:threonine aldolase family protein n=1 Tax=Streptomyces sp. DSM 15324 TaxID=1739111 RepID=UPI000748C55F|nr:beta-eliminating lyase-related protein [Streptomyces sp. DSM 15324]KUO08282.1 threonine aldolase [Streptomyces sp. DSM 15324]